MKVELKCPKCNFIAVLDCVSMEDIYIDRCPECGSELQKGWDI